MKIRMLSLENIMKSIWLYPMLYSFLAVFMVVAIMMVETQLGDDIYRNMPQIIATDSAAARVVLTITAGAFITIITFTFSTTMIVLTLYMSQFTPRVVENFLTYKGTMQSFGIFVSGFVYSILAIFMLPAAGHQTLTIAGTVGVVYSIIILANFILFINSVTTYIQVSSLITRLYSEAEARIKIYKEELENLQIVSRQKAIPGRNVFCVASPTNGYVQKVNYDSLLDIAREYETTLVFRKVPGQFVTDKTDIVTVEAVGDAKLQENISKRVQECFLVGDKRTETQDISFPVQKIVEIAVKTLSPGINDPQTAIYCTHIIALQLRLLADTEKGYALMTEEGAPGKLYYELFDFDLMLTNAFYQVVHYGQDDIAVMVAVIKGFRSILERATAANRKIILRHLGYYKKKMMNKAYEEFELDLLTKEMDDLELH